LGGSGALVSKVPVGVEAMDKTGKMDHMQKTRDADTRNQKKARGDACPRTRKKKKHLG